MTPVSLAKFSAIYDQSCDAVLAHYTPVMQEEMSRHCVDWAPGKFDFSVYLRYSAERYYYAYCEIVESGAKTLCDVGGFWGVFPITMKRLGFAVSMTEALKYYSSSFDDLFAEVRRQGVEIIDFDPFEQDVAALGRTFDALTLMAVLEHYPHSHAFVMKNMRDLLSPDGVLYIEAPNIAYLPKRIGLLRGRSPLVAIESKYHSKVPYIGHHHEFTMDHLRTLVDLSGFTVGNEFYYNYSTRIPGTFAQWLRYALPHRWREGAGMILYRLFPRCREVLSVSCRK